MVSAKTICGICLALLCGAVLFHVLQAREYRLITNDLSELRPNTRRTANGDIVIIDRFPDGIAPPPWDLGEMFVPPRVVAHSNSWQRLISDYRLGLEVTRIHESNGVWLADLKSPAYQSVFPNMRAGDHFYHASERFYVSSISSKAVKIQGLQNDRMETLRVPSMQGRPDN